MSLKDKLWLLYIFQLSDFIKMFAQNQTGLPSFDLHVLLLKSSRMYIRRDGVGGGSSQTPQTLKSRGKKEFEKALTQTRITANTNRSLPECKRPQVMAHLKVAAVILFTLHLELKSILADEQALEQKHLNSCSCPAEQ